MDAASAQAEASSLRGQARSHKRQANSHRRRAREYMQKLAALQAWCDRNGIKLVLEKEHSINPPRSGDPSGNTDQSSG